MGTPKVTVHGLLDAKYIEYVVHGSDSVYWDVGTGASVALDLTSYSINSVSYSYGVFIYVGGAGGSCNITSIAGASAGQYLILKRATSSTRTITLDEAGSNIYVNAEATTYDLSNGPICLLYNGSTWTEVFRKSGVTGRQGNAGNQGNQGNQGLQGNQGNQGLQGNQGNQGLQGNQGNQGNQGLQGYQGNQGLQGLQGSQGNQGNQGFQGNQGNQGFQGNIGYQGNQGNQGYQGFQGNQGANTLGSQGNQGYQGLQGNQGNQGLQGNQGYQGAQGNQGNQGFQGNIGLQGAQGFQGNQGNQGAQGFQGNQGNQGAQGNQGFQGSQGTSGFAGLQGSSNSGSLGFQGFQGYQGYQGNSGAYLIHVTGTFLSSNLTSNILTITHNLGIAYPLVIQIYDDNKNLVLPTEVNYVNLNTTTVDFTGITVSASLSWSYIIVY